MLIVVWLLLGLILGAAYTCWTRALPTPMELRALSTGLIVAAAIYVGFAVAWGTRNWVFLELSGVIIYSIFVFLTYRFSPYWLAAGWGFHPAWDVFLHLLGEGHTIAPYWYVVACISFDVLVAVYILILVAIRTSSPGPEQ